MAAAGNPSAAPPPHIVLILADDLGEQDNLVQKHPEKVGSLKAKLEAIDER